MNKRWFNAKEIAGLPGVPSTRQNVKLKARREKWQTRKRSALGGGNEYHIDSLPKVTQTALILCQKQHANEPDELYDDLLDVKPEDDSWGVVRTYKTRRLAQKLIWRLSDELVGFTRDKSRLIYHPDEIHLLSKSINWLSGIVVDDWSYHSFNEIYKEIKEISIGYLISRHNVGLWWNFCDEVAGQIEKQPEYGINNLKDSNDSHVSPNLSVKRYIHIGLRCGYLERGTFFKKRYYVENEIDYVGKNEQRNQV